MPATTQFAGPVEVALMVGASSRLAFGAIYVRLSPYSVARHSEASPRMPASVGWIGTRFRASREIPELLGDRRQPLIVDGHRAGFARFPCFLINDNTGPLLVTSPPRSGFVQPRLDTHISMDFATRGQVLKARMSRTRRPSRSTATTQSDRA